MMRRGFEGFGLVYGYRDESELCSNLRDHFSYGHHHCVVDRSPVAGANID